MTTKDEGIARLGRLAKLRSDLEMRRFSAFRANVEASRARIAEMETQLDQLYMSEAPFSVAQARLTNAMAGDFAREIRRESERLEQMLPRFEQARLAAAREFGRSEVISMIRRDMKAEALLKAARREG